MLDKQAITKQVLAQLPPDQSCAIEQARQTWWMNFRPSGGMRLTDIGYQAFLNCDFETYRFALPKGLVHTAKNLLTLDRKLHCPYYIEQGKKPTLILFGSEQAMMLALYGNLDQWLEFLARQ